MLCLDREGQANGNDGPFLGETEYMEVGEESDYELTAADGDIIWSYNMIEQLGVVPLIK